MLIIRKINNLQYRPVQVNCAKGALSDSDLLSDYPSEVGTALFCKSVKIMILNQYLTFEQLLVDCSYKFRSERLQVQGSKSIYTISEMK